MREIKFRAWTGKKMLYQDKQYLASFIRRIVPEIILDHGGESFSQHESYLPNGGEISEYLMQFTGLQDKNGKNIYDGDILELNCLGYGGTYKTRALITPRDVNWMLYTPDEPIKYQRLDKKWEPECEVIGNIYENPELLK